MEGVDVCESNEVSACVARTKRKGRAAPVQTVPYYDEHWLSHVPSKADCVICQQVKRKKKGCARGTIEGVRKGNGLEVPILTFDWLQPSKGATNGCRFIGVVGWVQKGVVFGWCTKAKKDKVVECIHAARVAWGIDGRKLSLFSEDEGALSVQRHNGIC